MTTFANDVDAQQTLKSGIDLTNMNTSVAPGKSFYDYACGGWMKKNPLPAAYSRYGSFDVLDEKCNSQIKGILTDLQQSDHAKGTIEQKVGDLYKLSMDSVRRNKQGTAPVQPMLKKLEDATNNSQLFELELTMASSIPSPFYGYGYMADEKQATENILAFMQGGLTLGEKSYYLDDDEATKQVREAYKRYVEKMFRIYGFSASEAKKKMQSVLSTETQLARVSRSRTELRDPEKNYNKMTLADFQFRYPNIMVNRLMQNEGVDTKYYQDLLVGQPDFLDGVNTLIGKISTFDYRTILEWRIIDDSAPYLSDETEAANFQFFGKEKSGRETDFPLWKRSVKQMNSSLGEAVGKIYAEKYFPESSKERMVQLVNNLKTALGERIQAQSWMSDSTKQNAMDKLSTFYVKIGYPNKWTDFSALTIDPNLSYYENTLACRKFWNKHDYEERVGKPVDKDHWYMLPHTVNAYYNPPTNEICFPAGILQPPFFDAEADDAFNYGAIGVVIGHEMTHGFDDQGRKYDKSGNMHEWWTESDAENFKQRTSRYADFFSKIEVLPGLNSNGELTLGENLADHGGLQVAFCALKNAMKNNPLPTIDGFTPEQRFFLAYANVWAANITDKEIRNRVKTDPHSLGRWRVDGALPHIDAWYDAFGITASDPMFVPKADRLDLW